MPRTAPPDVDRPQTDHPKTDRPASNATHALRNPAAAAAYADPREASSPGKYLGPIEEARGPNERARGSSENPSPDAQRQAGKSKKRIWLPVAAALVVLGVLVAVSAYVWPGWVPKTFSQNGLEEGVQRILSEDGGKQKQEVSDVTCPAGVKARKGEEFTCQLKVNGAPKYVTITVLDDDGNYLVSDPVD